MGKENNIVYVQTKKGIFKCYKSEQMHKPIYYPIEGKTNGYIDCYDVIEILNINDLYEQVKKQKEVIDKLNDFCKDDKNFKILDLYSQDIVDKIQVELLDILKEVSE